MPPYLSKAAVLDDLACLKAQKNIMTLHALKGAEKYTKTVSKFQRSFKKELRLQCSWISPFLD